jgi:hypothetical protein
MWKTYLPTPSTTETQFTTTIPNLLLIQYLIYYRFRQVHEALARLENIPPSSFLLALQRPDLPLILMLYLNYYYYISVTWFTTATATVPKSLLLYIQILTSPWSSRTSGKHTSRLLALQVYVLMLLYMCPHTTIYVSNVRTHTTI